MGTYSPLPEKQNLSRDASPATPMSRRKRFTAVALAALLLMYLMTFGCSVRAPVPLSTDQRVERILRSSPVIGMTFAIANAGCR